MAEESSGEAVDSQKIQIVAKKNGRKTVLFQLLFALPLIVVSLIYLESNFQDAWEGMVGYGSVSDYGLPPKLMEKFSEYDADANGCIDPDEFATLSMVALRQSEDLNVDMNEVHNNETYQFEDPWSGPGTYSIIVKAEMTPIDIKTMSKFADKNNYLVGGPSKLVPGLVAWKEPMRQYDMFGTGNFGVFFPNYGKLTVGEPYFIIADHEDFASMNRHRPPKPAAEHALIHTLLSMFHQNVFVISRFGPRGSVAVIRAMNEDTVDIMFRIHAEYQLNRPPDYPFWFTPGQFTGRLIIDKNYSKIHYFELHLPTDKQLNIDMEWISGPGSNEVDIGFMSKMKLVGSPTVPFEEESNIPDILLQDNYEPTMVDLAWDSEISEQEALRKLEVTLYPFKKVYYHSFVDAISTAVSSSSGRTLREGPLECLPILTLLDSNFISSWALVAELKAVMSNQTLTSKDRRIAELVLEEYEFPVEIMVLNVTSEEESVVRKMNANTLLDSTEKDTNILGRCDPTSSAYLDFLKKGSVLADL